MSRRRKAIRKQAARLLRTGVLLVFMCSALFLTGGCLVCVSRTPAGVVDEQGPGCGCPARTSVRFACLLWPDRVDELSDEIDDLVDD